MASHRNLAGYGREVVAQGYLHTHGVKTNTYIFTKTYFYLAISA
jgi:hypothetical protein